MSKHKVQILITVLSLALNVLLIGYTLGCGSFRNSERHHMPMPDMSSLPAEKQERIKGAMDEFIQQNNERFETIRAKRKEIATILTAETFDVDAFKAKATELDQLFIEGKRGMLEKMADLASGMSQEERTVLAGYLRRPPPDRIGGPPEVQGPPRPKH